MDYKFYLNKGIQETNEGKFDEALHSLNRAIGLKNDDALAYFSLAIVFHNLNEIQSAYDNYSKAIELNPKMTDAYYNRAQVLLTDKNADEDTLKSAMSDLDRSVELDPKFVDAMYYKATIQKKLGCRRYSNLKECDLGSIVFGANSVKIAFQATGSPASGIVARSGGLNFSTKR